MQGPEAAMKSAELNAKFLAYSNLLDAAIYAGDETAIAAARQNLLFAVEESIDQRIAVSKAILAAAATKPEKRA